MKTILKVAYITFIFLLVPINVVNANADTFEVEIGWTHSGKGMDRFVFSYSSVNAGPWINTYQVMIIELIPVELEDGKTKWSAVIPIEANSFDDLKWWTCYAETSYGTKSAVSSAVEAILKPKPPTDLEQISEQFKRRRISVNFI